MLNAVAREPDLRVWSDWQRGAADADGVEWSILFSPSVSGAIRRMHLDGLVEVRWLTTWRRQANGRLRRLLDLPSLDVVPDAGTADVADGVASLATMSSAGSHGGAVAASASDGNQWWKFAAVRALAEELRRPLIWTDDELSTQPEAVQWVRRMVADPLIVSPAPQSGLTPQHLTTIEDFCRLRTGRLD